MDNELKHLKDHLNRTVYRGAHFTEKNKMKIRERIHQSGELHHFNRFKAALSVIVCFALLIALGAFAWGQMTASKTTPQLSAQGDQGEASNPIINHVTPFLEVYAQHSQQNGLDCVMILAVNPKTQSVTLLSLPPNLQVRPGEDLQDAFSVDKLDQAIAKVLDIPRHSQMMVIVDDSFRRSIDEIGGIEVNNPFDFTYMGERFAKGSLQLDGKEALAYFTMLKEDPKGEIGRMDRQQEVVRELLKRVSIADLEKYFLAGKETDNFYSILQHVVKKDQANHFQIKSLYLTVQPKDSYYVATPEDLQTITEQLKKQLR